MGMALNTDAIVQAALKHKPFRKKDRSLILKTSDEASGFFLLSADAKQCHRKTQAIIEMKDAIAADVTKENRRTSLRTSPSTMCSCVPVSRLASSIRTVWIIH